jgi:outer membrane protein insertion porin family
MRDYVYKNISMIKKYLLASIAMLISSFYSSSQTAPFSYSNPEEYCIKGINVSGIQFLDPTVIVSISGLYVGDTISIPGERTTHAINKLWDQGLFSDIKITASKIEGDDIFIDIFLQELPRISAIELTGIKKNEDKDIRDLIKLRVGGQATDNILDNTTRIIKNHFRSKAFLNSQVEIFQEKDTMIANGVRLTFAINKGPKVRISDIFFEGNIKVSDRRLRRALKNTKRRDMNFFKASKFIESDYADDKLKLIDFYNEKGFRDAKILGDSIYIVNEKRIGIVIRIEEGPKYYYRNITWIGNSKLPDEALNNLLGIKKGDVYDKSLLEKRLFMDENSITTAYMDDGYLFFNLEPVEVRVENDSIDLEMRMHEGDQATINKINIQGNSKTHENVIRRELYSKPGDLFSKTNITRSIRELANLGHFDPEKLDVRPMPNPTDGTVDLTFIVEEKANDQLEISGGWGAKMFVGTIGIRFSNFSMGRVFDKDAWRPIPSGDSQTLSLRAQTNGSFYKAFSLTFVEPWLGGKKPTNFTFSLYHTIQNNPGTWLYQTSDQSMKVTGGAIGIGTRLKWPDDFFTFYNELSYQNYSLSDWDYFIIKDGKSNNFSYKVSISRNSVDQLIYPRRGSNFNLTLQATPPFSLINNKDYSTITENQEKYKWIEYHKWTGKVQWYQTIIQNLVLYTGAQFGYLGFYNPDIGYSPFEGFDLGGDGMSGYNLYGRETIGLRGYGNGSLTPLVTDSEGRSVRNANIYNKYTVELRYPITLQPQAAIYFITFLEAGNAWYDFYRFNPFNIHRSAGAGVRLFLPMIGMLGVDWGYGFDKIPHSPNSHKGQFHFQIGMPF